MKRYKSIFKEESKARTVRGYLSPEPGDLPEEGAQMLADIYANAREAGNDKELSSKIAWSAVRNKYPEKK